jgi:hypothetical protein
MFALKFLENISYILGDVSFLNIGLCFLNISQYVLMFFEHKPICAYVV